MLYDELKVPERQIGRDIERFISNTSRKHWHKVIGNIENTQGHFYKIYLYKRNPLAKAIKSYNYLSRKGKSIWENMNDEIRLLGSTAYLFNYLYKNLNDYSQNILMGRIKEDDIRALLFEFKIVTHFFRIGAKIDFVDYVNREQDKQTFDFYIQKENKEFEVECKYKDYDSKRKLTRPAMYLLV